jgi:hypothetical protein
MTTLRIHPATHSNQNLILDKLNEEVVQIQSVKGFYISRHLVAKDDILGEDRLSEFRDAYPIDIYIESADGFEGQNSFASKFGLQIDSNAVFVISRRGWDLAVGRFGNTILPNRPAEGDLIHLPMTSSLFEIDFVNHESPFYQLGQFYTYKMNVSMFRYSSEKIDTGINAIDIIEDKHTADVSKRADIDTLKRGADNNKFKSRASEFVFSNNNPFGDL